MTCSYPITYIVDQEQIDIAKKLIESDKTDILSNIGNKLVFVGMGMSYESRYENDVCNYRVRTYFNNKFLKRCFIEFGTGADNKTICITHAHICDYNNNTKENNYRGLERKDLSNTHYTTDNIMGIVNNYFDCKFTEIVIDNYTLSPNDFVCNSPV